MSVKLIEDGQFKELLDALDVQMSDEHRLLFEEHFETTLHERIGLAIVGTLNAEKQAEFEQVTKSGDKTQIVNWLTTNVPNHMDIITQQIDILLEELAQNSDNL